MARPEKIPPVVSPEMLLIRHPLSSVVDAHIMAGNASCRNLLNM